MAMGVILVFIRSSGAADTVACVHACEIEKA